jgi:hypothetical protein
MQQKETENIKQTPINFAKRFTDESWRENFCVCCNSKYFYTAISNNEIVEPIKLLLFHNFSFFIESLLWRDNANIT